MKISRILVFTLFPLHTLCMEKYVLQEDTFNFIISYIGQDSSLSSEQGEIFKNYIINVFNPQEIKELPHNLPADIKKHIFTHFIRSKIKEAQFLPELKEIFKTLIMIDKDLSDLKTIRKADDKKSIVRVPRHLDSQPFHQLDLKKYATLCSLSYPRFKGPDIVNKGIDAQDDHKHTMLYLATVEDNAERAELLIHHGANLNIRDTFGWTPLHCAARHNHVEVARVLVDNKADLNLQNAIGNDTALHITIDQQSRSDRDGIVMGNTEIAELLIKNNANINLVNEQNQTALHRAAINNAFNNIVKLLIEHKASIDARDNYDWTPLHCAAHNNALENVKTLIDTGADTSLATSSGKTASDLAKENSETTLDLVRKKCCLETYEFLKTDKP